MKTKFLLIVLIFFLFLTLNPVSAQGLFQDWYEYLNIPEDYSEFPNLLYFVLLPFLGTFAIIWGILTNLRIFKLRKVNILLSFIFAFALLYTGALLAFVGVLFQIGATFGVIVFFVLFIALTGLWGYRRTYEEYGITKTIYEKYKDVGKRREERIKKVTEMDKEINKILKKIEVLDGEIRELNEVMGLVSERRTFSRDEIDGMNRILTKFEFRFTTIDNTLRNIDRELRKKEGRRAKLAGELKERKKERAKISKKLKETLEA